MKQPDDAFYKAFNQRKVSGFPRFDSELKWILNYPWISNTNNNQSYFFSHYAKIMYYQFVLIKNDSGEMSAWAILHFRDGMLKVPYYDAENQELACLACYLIYFAKKAKIEQFRCFDADLASAVRKESHPFINQKPAQQNVYAAWETKPENPIVADGDGDYIFT